MRGSQHHQRNIHLPPILPPLISQLVQHLRHVVVTIIAHYVVVGSLKFFVGFVNGIVPLVGGVTAVVENEVFERATESQLPAVHGSHPHEIVDGAVGFADAGVADAGEAAGDAGEGRPDYGVGVAVVLYIDLHLDFDIFLHQ